MNYTHFKEEQSFTYSEDYEGKAVNERSCHNSGINLCNLNCEERGSVATVLYIVKNLFQVIEKYHTWFIINLSLYI
jgi:hypothetical protein